MLDTVIVSESFFIMYLFYVSWQLHEVHKYVFEKMQNFLILNLVIYMYMYKVSNSVIG